MTGPERCSRCDRPMIRGKKKHPPAGYVRHDCHGQCHNCRTNAARPVLPKGGGIKRGRPANCEADSVVIDRVVCGERLPMNTAELSSVISILTRRGESARQIAIRIGCSPDTVHRHRTRLRTRVAA